MSSYQPVEGIKFDVGQDKDSVETRTARGVKVTTLAPQSPLFQDPEVKVGILAVISDTEALKEGVDVWLAAQATLRQARSALVVLMSNWDRSYDMLLAAGVKHCLTADEGASLGLTVRPKTIHTFERPLSIVLKHNVVTAVLRIHVKRGPGSHSLCVQVSENPEDPTAWIELDGDGAVREIKNPAPGTWWVRAASRSARAQSEFTTPVSIIVK
jgi:hypothetical protein